MVLVSENNNRTEKRETWLIYSNMNKALKHYTDVLDYAKIRSKLVNKFVFNELKVIPVLYLQDIFGWALHLLEKCQSYIAAENKCRKDEMKR